MSDHTHNALAGICNALTDVVAPAVSEQDPLAQQELRMAVRYLAFLEQRIDHLHERARFELRHFSTLATTVRHLGTAPTEDHVLAEAIARAHQLLSSADASMAVLRECTDQLTAALAGVVRRSAVAADPAVRRDVEQAVVRASAELTSFERSWYLPLGMDHFGGEVPPLSAFLTATTPASHV